LMNYQLFSLKRRFLELRGDRSHWVRDQTLHWYVWHAMKTAHNANAAGKDDILRHMIGDLRLYSLTPTGRKDKTDNLEDDASSNEEDGQDG
jgi:hypothetical protein